MTAASSAARRRVTVARPPEAGDRIVSVLPAVAGIDRAFDYLVEPTQEAAAGVGSVVRVDLHGRRVAGWVVADGPTDDGSDAGGHHGAGTAAPRRLRPLAHVSGWGPEPQLVALSAWAAWRWTGRRGAFLRTASPEGAVPRLPPPLLRPPAPPPSPVPGAARDTAELAADALTRPSPSILRLPPVSDPTVLVAAVAQRGPTLVVVPSTARAAVLAQRLRRAGAGVAVVPGEWAQARAGAGVVIGARAAAWAPCPGLAAVVVLDAHDEALVQEQAPTWWATAVAAERARRAGVPCLWVSPCPTLDLVASAPAAPVVPPVDRERGGWAPVEVVDRSDDDPRLGLWSERLVRAVRGSGRVVCVLNRTGRAGLLVCGACRAVARCERCGAAVVQPAAPVLVCRRCGAERPPLCLVCHSTRLRRLKVGVAGAATELAALAGRAVTEVTAATDAVALPEDGTGFVLVGTEAALHRVGAADVVAFVDFDQELLAPRLRAAEEALGLLALASRLVGGRRRNGHLLVQTRLPGHAVLTAARLGDSSSLTSDEDATRSALRLPPHAALAVLSGGGAAAYAAAATAAEPTLVATPGAGGAWLLRAPATEVLCDALAGAPRPAGAVRVEVDPVRF